MNVLMYVCVYATGLCSGRYDVWGVLYGMYLSTVVQVVHIVQPPWLSGSLEYPIKNSRQATVRMYPYRTVYDEAYLYR